MKTVILVRHADIDVGAGPTADDTPLNAAGVTRAETLAVVLRSVGLTAIFISPVLRTKLIAAPTIVHTGLTPKIGVTAAELTPLILAGEAGDRILVVGHSNTVPEIVAALGATLSAPFLGFDNLIVATISAPGLATALYLKYGMTS